MMDPQVTKRLREPIPGQLIKQLSGNDYISGQTAIDRLIQATDNNWSFRISNVIVNTGHVAMQGELTIGGETRSAWGEAKSTNNPKEELFKNCETDTLKRCARLFGVALELYGDWIDDQTGEVMHKQTAAPRQHAPQARQRPDTRRYAQPADAALHDAQTSAHEVAGRDLGHATPKQAGFIGRLMKELEWTREDAERYLDATYGVKRVSDLGSNQDVSAFIDHLLAVKAANEPAPAGVS